jgi:hypothetical protein
MNKMLATAFLGLTLLSLQTVEGQHYGSYAIHFSFAPVYGGSPTVSQVPTYSPEDVYEYTNDLDDVPNSNNSPDGNTNENDKEFDDTSFNDTNNDEGDTMMPPPPPSSPSNENTAKRLYPQITLTILGLIGYWLVCM